MEQLINRPLYRVIIAINSIMSDLLSNGTLRVNEITSNTKFNSYKKLQIDLYLVYPNGDSRIISSVSCCDLVLKDSYTEDIVRLTDLTESKMINILLLMVKDNFRNV